MNDIDKSNRIHRAKKRSPNFHLQRLGVAGAYATPKNCPNPPGDSYRSLSKRYEKWEILYEAKVAYRKKITHCHPDHGGDPETAKELAESLQWVKKWCKRRS